MNNKAIAEQIFLSGVESVLPSKLIPSNVSLNENILVVGEHKFSLSEIEHIYVIGAGKASGMMAQEVEKILGDRITGGHIIVKHGHSVKSKRITITEAAHPVPDSNGFKATGSILRMASDAGKNDLVICLLSGGGSALLADFPGGSSAGEMMIMNDLLVNSGAAISEINAVRKHLSAVKGGQLARAVYPAMLVSLILSDVPGNFPDVIASGPTVPDPTTFEQAYDVLRNFNLIPSVPAGLLKHIEEGIAGNKPETPKGSDPSFVKTTNILIGTNRMALEAAGRKALEYNINPVIIDDQVQGDIYSVAEYIVETALKFKKEESEIKPVCLLFGGETTLRMTGKGAGGRNQHLALLAAILLRNSQGMTLLSAGTDGTDGPTAAAGAVVDSFTYSDSVSRNINPEKFIEEFDSYHFFKKAGGHIITGPTMTNVMDIIVVIAK